MRLRRLNRILLFGWCFMFGPSLLLCGAMHLIDYVGR